MRQAISPRLAMSTDLNMWARVVGPILACWWGCRLGLWTFGRRWRSAGAFIDASLGIGCPRLVFRRRRLGIHNANRRDRGGGGKVVAAVDWMTGCWRPPGTRDGWQCRSRCLRLFLGWRLRFGPSRCIAGDIAVEGLNLQIGLEHASVLKHFKSRAAVRGAAVAHSQNMGSNPI